MPSAYGCQSRMMFQTPNRQKCRNMRYRKTLLLTRHSYINWSVNGTCTASSYGLRCLHQTALMTSQVSSETQSVSQPFSSLEGAPRTSSSVDHDTSTSSVQSCSAIFTPNQDTCYLRLKISGLHENTISHCITGLLITVLRLLDSNPTWSSVEMVIVSGRMSALRQRAFSYRPRYSAYFLTVCIVSHTQDWRPDWCSSNCPTGGKAPAKTSQGGQNHVQLAKQRIFMSTRKFHMNDCEHRLNASAIVTSI